MVQSLSAVILETKKIKSVTASTFSPSMGMRVGPLKNRDIPLLTKVHIVKAVGFLVVMYGCESWTVKKAEQRRTDALGLRCCRRLLRVPWTTRKSNQSILKEINPEYSLEGLMLKLKLQYSGHLMLSRLIGKDPNAGKDWGQKEKVVAEEESIR